jgi:hypothetical protein
MQSVHRVEHQIEGPPPVELSDQTLAGLLAVLDSLCEGQVGRRQNSRLRVQGQVMMTPLEAGGHPTPRAVGVYDISRNGIAVVDEKPMEDGEQFSVLLPRIGQPAVEMICTARHSRAQNGQFVIGARYGSPSSNGGKSSTLIAAAIRAKGAAPVG